MMMLLGKSIAWETSHFGRALLCHETFLTSNVVGSGAPIWIHRDAWRCSWREASKTSPWRLGESAIEGADCPGGSLGSFQTLFL